MSIAFVLSGGGNLGAVQAGQIRALLEAGVRPDLIVGTSVGAINGAFLAGACDLDGCDELLGVWKRLKRGDIFPTRPVLGFMGFIGRSSSLVPSTALRALLRRHLRFSKLEDSPIPLYVVACELRSGAEVLLSTGDAADAVTASAAIPGIFPPVVIGGRTLVDGGVANNAPISHAMALGATTVYVLACGYACSLAEAPRAAGAIAMQAVAVLVHQRLVLEVEHLRSRVNLRVAPTLCPVAISPLDFSHSERLAADSYAATKAWIAEDMPDIVSSLGGHAHG